MSMKLFAAKITKVKITLAKVKERIYSCCDAFYQFHLTSGSLLKIYFIITGSFQNCNLFFEIFKNLLFAQPLVL